MTQRGAVEARPRRLGELISELESRGLLRTVLPGAGSPAAVETSSVVMDSRAVAPGSLFVAVPGAHVDGHEFIPGAVGAGAAAVIAERATPGLSVPQLLVPAARPVLAMASSWWHGFPSHRLGVVGITGTDGKTTVSFMVRAMLEACGYPTGMVGTVQAIAGGKRIGGPTRATTPEAPELQGHLAAMLAAGDRMAVVESTSHGLAQERVGAIAYDVAVLTNLTHEHLEFHRTLDAYHAAKRRLFERLAVSVDNPQKGWGKTGIVNLDDAAAGDFARAAREAGARVLGYSAGQGADAADVRAIGVREDAQRLRIEVRTPRWSGQVALRMAGRFNVHNALAAITVIEALGLDGGAARDGLEALEGVPGRMERIDAGQPFTVIVDYAHTPDALSTVLDNLAPLAAAGGGGIIAVFGSAGERDTQKRPMMGRVAGERCRLVVVTDEDPRGEDRQRILEQIADGAEMAGARRGQGLRVVPDRSDAIAQAMEAARPGDVVLLAGKGHEATIEMADGSRPWNEAAEARRALAAVGYAS